MSSKTGSHHVVGVYRDVNTESSGERGVKRMNKPCMSYVFRGLI